MLDFLVGVATAVLIGLLVAVPTPYSASWWAVLAVAAVILSVAAVERTARGLSRWRRLPLGVLLAGGCLGVAWFFFVPSAPDGSPKWLRVAYSQLGTAEVELGFRNPKVYQYFASLHDGKAYDPHRDDWASAFVEWTMAKAGNVGPRSAEPFAWLKWGRPVAVPELGCIAVLAFGGEGGLHHVGFVTKDLGDSIDVLGGDEDDAVSIKDYSKSAVLGYRMPTR